MNMTNGNGKTTWWMMGLIAAIIVACVTSWLGFVYANIDDIHKQGIARENRIARLEECILSNKERLARIEQKIDLLMNGGTLWNAKRLAN